MIIIIYFIISGKGGNAYNFQVNLLEGLDRLNEDTMAATNSASPGPIYYSASLKNSVNNLGQEMLGREFFPIYVDPGKYTG